MQKLPYFFLAILLLASVTLPNASAYGASDISSNSTTNNNVPNSNQLAMTEGTRYTIVSGAVAEPTPGQDGFVLTSVTPASGNAISAWKVHGDCSLQDFGVFVSVTLDSCVQISGRTAIYARVSFTYHLMYGTTNSQVRLDRASGSVGGLSTVWTIPGSIGSYDYYVNSFTGGGFSVGFLFTATPAVTTVNCLPTLASGLTVQPNPGNFTTPNQAYFFTNNSDANNTYYWTIFKSQNNNQITQVDVMFPFVGYNTTQIWPPGRSSVGNGTLSDIGSYVFVVTTANGTITATVPFIFYNGIGQVPTLIRQSDSLNTTMQSQVIVSLVSNYRQANTQAQINQTAQSQSFIISATNWAFQTQILVPNMWLILIICLVVAVIIGGLRR